MMVHGVEVENQGMVREGFSGAVRQQQHSNVSTGGRACGRQLQQAGPTSELVETGSKSQLSRWRGVVTKPENR